QKDDSYFNGLSKDLQAKRDRLSEGLQGLGFTTMESQGTYFLTVDFRPLGFNGNDVDFCRHITTEAGVTAVPISAFYSQGDVDHFARFCFCKGDALLDEAIGRLEKHFKG
ncbi:MAG: aminotransferase class I/II-fold pyridoxal phosphate-dependent enzyme, partial [Rhodospirillaceae bacterium]|nr:aminotransferase class I/II-fold pyridoxal phosphate-dependent enzyme [Rhodospirillaceae bacterium]